MTAPHIYAPAVSDRPERPRVVHVITRLIVGGAQLTAAGLCTEMADRFATSLVTGVEAGPEGSLRERVEPVVPIYDIPALRRRIDPRWDTVAVVRLRRLLKDLRPDIVHTHSSKAGIIGRVAARGVGARLVHSVHGWGHTPADPAVRRWLLVRIERAIATWTDALVAVSDDVRQEGVRSGIGTPDQYVVIPELVDLRPHDRDFGAARRRARHALGISGVEGSIVGWVGRYVPQKDPRLLGEAIARVLTELPDAHAVLIGDGPLRGRVEQQLASAGVADRVCFAGLRSDVRQLYAAMDVVLHPSLWEGQPRVVQEALAERVPVVATHVSGVSQLIRDGANGFVVPTGDSDGMARRTVEALHRAALRPPLAEEALVTLTEVAGAKRCLDGHEELYQRLLAER